MITFEEIRQAIGQLIDEAKLPLAVTFNRVDKATCDYAYVELQQDITDEGCGMVIRRVRVHIMIRLQPENTEIDAEKLQGYIMALNAATSSFVRVADRYITIYNTAARIVDEILHYDFELKFADYIEKSVGAGADEEFKKMEELHIGRKN